MAGYARSLLASFVVAAFILCAAASPAYSYRALGDTGKPADYEQTKKSFKNGANDLASSVLQSLTPSFDFRDQGVVAPARDQGSCGSCWAFAVAGVFESKLLMAGEGSFDLSEQQQVSCNMAMAGCNGGNSTALRYWEGTGPMEESCTGYPSYNGNNSSCSLLSACQILNYSTREYYTVDTGDVTEIKSSLYADGPAYFSFLVYTDFFDFWDTYSPGRVYKQATGRLEGGHAVLLIGWDDSKQAWLLKNSWGATGGPNGDGTFWMAYAGHAQQLDFGTANVHINVSSPAVENCPYGTGAAAYSFTDISSSGLDLKLTDDSVRTITLPFPFSFYCKDYTTATIDSNGLIHLSGTSSFPNNTTLPSTEVAEPLIAPFWMDLLPSTISTTGGKVYALTTGTAPNRVLIVEWKNMPCYGGAQSATVTFQARLYEGSNRIEFHYQDVVFSGNAAADYGGAATIGIQRNSSEGVLYSYKATSLSNGQAIAFEPSGAGDQSGTLTVTISPSEVVSAGAQWQVDGGAWNNSGTSVSVSAGSHTVTFKSVSGWTAPASKTVTVTAGASTAAAGAYTRQSGSLRVILGPSAAVSAGARWQVDGGGWYASGATVTGLPVGTHTIGFSTVAAWNTPAAQSVTISNGVTTTATATYVQQPGSVTVTITPEEAVAAGAQWRLDRGVWRGSGETATGVTPGRHTVSFRAVTGWDTPAGQYVTVSGDSPVSLTGNYVLQTGSLRVVIKPSAAVSAGAQWQVDGGGWYAGGATITGLPVGTHTIGFSTVAGWVTPANITVRISRNKTTGATGTYVPTTGSVRVSLRPAGAIAAGAQWQIDGGEWMDSGETLANLSPGTHTVSVKEVSGWTSPRSGILKVARGKTTSAVRIYMQQGKARTRSSF